MMRARNALLSSASLAILLATAGCNRHQARTDQTEDSAALPALPAALPLSSAPVSGPIATAPSAARLPPARPLELGYVPDDQDYAWIDRADMLFDTIGDAPPDYGFDYDGVEPWAWETSGGYDIYAEPIDDGYRYYYYEPGAYEPFLVRDPSYSYGYGGGRLVAVYAGGRRLGRAEAAREAEAAARYWARARALRSAARAPDRRPVAAMRWAQQRPDFIRARQQWTQARERDPAWRQWRARTPDSPARARLQAEQQVRAAAAGRFAQWQRQGLRGAPPRLYPAAIAQRQVRTAMRPERGRAAPVTRPQERPDARQALAAQQAQQEDRARAAQARGEIARLQAQQARAQAAQAAQARARMAQAQARQARAQRAALAAPAAIRQQAVPARGVQARERLQAQARARQQAAAGQMRAREQVRVQAQARQQARAAQVQAQAAQRARGAQAAQARAQAQAAQRARGAQAAQARAQAQAAQRARGAQAAQARAQAQAVQARAQAQAAQRARGAQAAQARAQAQAAQQARAAQRQVRAQPRAAAPQPPAGGGRDRRHGHGH